MSFVSKLVQPAIGSGLTIQVLLTYQEARDVLSALYLRNEPDLHDLQHALEGAVLLRPSTQLNYPARDGVDRRQRPTRRRVYVNGGRRQTLPSVAYAAGDRRTNAYRRHNWLATRRLGLDRRK